MTAQNLLTAGDRGTIEGVLSHLKTGCPRAVASSRERERSTELITVTNTTSDSILCTNNSIEYAYARYVLRVLSQMEQALDSRYSLEKYLNIQALASEAITNVHGEAFGYLSMSLYWQHRRYVDVVPLADALNITASQFMALVGAL